jgi:putative transposase
MPRANRLRGTGGVFHVTHRCHDRAFLLKFARDRDAYRERLRQHLQHREVSLLDYCLTSNHVHLLISI